MITHSSTSCAAHWHDSIQGAAGSIMGQIFIVNSHDKLTLRN